MQINMNVKAGRVAPNHHQTAVLASKLKTNLKAGVVGDPNGGYESQQNNQTAAGGLKVKTGIKAGPPDTPTARD